MWASLFYLSIGLYLSIQLYALVYWPLPWFDETYFASIAWNFVHTGQLIPQVAVFEEVKLYGFIYFLLTGWSMKWLGFSIFSFRLVNFLLGFGVIGLTTLLARDLMPRFKGVTYFLPVLLALDPFFNLSLHEGRMDLSALFFMLLGLRHIQLALPKNQYLHFIGAAFWMDLALLTTPRIGFILLALGLYLFIWSLPEFKKRGLSIFIWSATLVLVYSLWVLYTFGDWGSLIEYYLQPSHKVHEDNSLYDLFIGWNGYIPRVEYLLIICAWAATCFGLINKPASYQSALIFICLLSIILFYLLIADYGPYSIFILPFYYLLFFYGLQVQPFNTKNPIAYLGLLLLLFNASYFTLKNAQAYSAIPQRTLCTARQFVQSHIPAGSRVVGEPMYYYAVMQAGSDYQYMNQFETLEGRARRQLLAYNVQFLIVTDQMRVREPQVIAHYFSQGGFEEIARLEIPASPLNQWIENLGLLSPTERAGYNATIYKRIW